MILAFFVSITAIVLLARLFAGMIVFALPLYCAGLSAMYAWQHGLGIPAAVLAAAAASAFALLVGAKLLVGSPSIPARVFVSLAFALPAGLAGYHAVQGIWGAFAPVGMASIIVGAGAALYFGLAAQKQLLSAPQG
ncbi:hypothetical protein ACFOON_08060 [Novosphingobium piscinae]|uniref:Uncharacterized protein n=1 Tax=Novosphingobium piscinae TaxID=1507448 RepID=A0A7X1FYA9_9SPHN|nr:hypothetical protein [Novosphingobium piscinae]MBC2669220.1 hypothetical protein [Novosphingobium piscinae]